MIANYRAAHTEKGKPVEQPKFLPLPDSPRSMEQAVDEEKAALERAEMDATMARIFQD